MGDRPSGRPLHTSRSTRVTPDLLLRTTPRYERRWCADDAIIYALSVGAGGDDPTVELEYTTEGGTAYRQAALDGFASVLGKPHPDAYGLLLGDVDRSAVLQSGYELEWVTPTPLPVEGSLWATTMLTAVFAHRRGCFVTLESPCAYEGSDEIAFITRSKVFVRGLVVDGAAPHPKRPEPTDGEPDLVVSVQTNPQQALLHRLLGDRNPLHFDPAVAAAAGYDRPILHGLCTFGMAARILGRAIDRGGPEPVSYMTARFTAAVVPGDPLTLHAWQATEETYLYSMTSTARREQVLDGLWGSRNSSTSTRRSGPEVLPDVPTLGDA
jgi:acyl dehydratase